MANNIRLEDSITNLEFILKIKSPSRRVIFKFLRTKMDRLRKSNPWAHGKISRGYSCEISDSQLLLICKRLLPSSGSFLEKKTVELVENINSKSREVSRGRTKC